MHPSFTTCVSYHKEDVAICSTPEPNDNYYEEQICNKMLPLKQQGDNVSLELAHCQYISPIQYTIPFSEFSLVVVLFTPTHHLFPLMLLLQLLTLQRELSNGLVSTPQLLSEHLHFLNQLFQLKTHTYSLQQGQQTTSVGNWRKIKNRQIDIQHIQSITAVKLR